jgi:hypothetical protein
VVILLLNLFVVAVKVVVGVRTNSLSVLGAALESTLDLLNNIVGIVLVKLAAIEPARLRAYDGVVHEVEDDAVREYVADGVVQHGHVRRLDDHDPASAIEDRVVLDADAVGRQELFADRDPAAQVLREAVVEDDVVGVVVDDGDVGGVGAAAGGVGADRRAGGAVLRLPAAVGAR